MEHYKDEPSLNKEDAIFGFGDNKNQVSFKFKQKITGQTGKDGKTIIIIIIIIIITIIIIK